MLTEKQKRFCDEYIKTGNAKQSYMLAYNADAKVSEANSSRLLSNAKIVEYIAKVNTEIREVTIADMKEVKQFWSDILRDKLQTPAARLKASEYIAKTNGAFIERVEHSGNTGVTIINDIPRNKTK